MGSRSSPAPLQAPQYVQPPPDPLFLQQQARAQRDQTASLQTQATIDTASIMARYGSFAALGGSGAAPLSLDPAAVTTPPLGLGLIDTFSLMKLRGVG